jgi:hypothetical protein
MNTDDKPTLDAALTLRGNDINIEAVADRVAAYLNSLGSTRDVSVSSFASAVIGGHPVTNNAGLDEISDYAITGNQQLDGEPRAGTVTIHYEGETHEFEYEPETYILGYDDEDD